MYNLLKIEKNFMLLYIFRNKYYIKITLLLRSACKEKNYVFFVNINF
ncbi:conserved hypothetical protein [Listeria monocytogenes FSL F2-208]|nr:conserved hypothetical protein [Listeria monocytogenes FSL F2-208]